MRNFLFISSFYPGNLSSFYNTFPDYEKYTYYDLNKRIIDFTTEFAGSYSRALRRLGNRVECIVGNDSVLQGKWMIENNFKKSQKDILFNQIRELQPEILWIDNFSLVNSELLKRIRNEVKSVSIIAGYHCAPYDKRIIERLKEADVVFTCIPGFRDDFKKNGLNAYHIYHGFDTGILKKLETNISSERKQIIFSGSLSTGGSYHSSRIELLEKLIEENIDIELFVNLENSSKILTKKGIYRTISYLPKVLRDPITNKLAFLRHSSQPIKKYSKSLISRSRPPVYGIEMYKLMRDSDMVLNFHIGATGSYAGNMRIFEATGMGSCLLTEDKLNMRELFEPGKEVITFSSNSECIEKIKWLTEHPADCKEIASNGQIRTLKDHTVELRCLEILDIINKEILKK